MFQFPLLLLISQLFLYSTYALLNLGGHCTVNYHYYCWWWWWWW